MERAAAATGAEASWSTVAVHQANPAGMLVDVGRPETAAVAIGRAPDVVSVRDEYRGLRAHVATVDSLVESALGNSHPPSIERSRQAGPVGRM